MALLHLLASPLQAQDVTGTWEITSETQRGSRSFDVTFVQNGAEVEGTAILQMRGPPGGGGGGSPQEVPITDGAMDGDQLTFTLSMGMGDRTFSQTFTATVSGDTMEGTITTPRGENPFTGTKKEG
jgi:hypothetical protein